MKLRQIILSAVAALTLAACGSQSSSTASSQSSNVEPVHVKVAVTGSQQHEVWDFVAEKAKKENIEIEVVEMNDYVQPNKALVEGSVQMNSFQHRAYLAQWNKDNNANLTEIGTTFIVPLYYFSAKYTSLQDLPEGAKVAIPKEVAIQGRALVALQTAGLITLKDGGSTKSSVADIVSNPRNLEIIEVESAQAPRILSDVDAATVNGSMATDAGLNVADAIFTDADYLETIPTDRYNIIVVRAEDVNNETYKKIVELFQADDVVEKLNEIAPGQYYPVWKK